MSTKIIRRGYDPEDDKWFSREAETKLSKAMEDFQYLLDRGYKSQPTIDFIGNHYLLSARQRTAIQRLAATEVQYEKRKAFIFMLCTAYGLKAKQQDNVFNKAVLAASTVNCKKI